MSTTALAIANHIIITANKKDTPINILKLQHVLYLLWKDYGKTTGEILFWDPFIAEISGPVIQNVKNNFVQFGGLPLDTDSVPDSIPCNVIGTINDLLLEKRYLFYSEQKLESTVKQNAWKQTWNNGQGKNHKIPFTWIAKEK